MKLGNEKQKCLTFIQKSTMKGKVIGLGGVFLKFKSPDIMRNWYANVLGLTTNDYGVLFTFNHDNKPAHLQLGTFPEDSDYFGSVNQQAMINFRVDDMDQMINKLKENDVKICNDVETYDYGKFIHIEDPEGNRIELWEPIDQAFSNEPNTKMY